MIIRAIWRKVAPDRVKRIVGEVSELPKNMKVYHFGNENRDKCFMIIKNHNDKAGIFSTIFGKINNFVWAEKMHCIPIVDLQNSFVPLMQDEEKRGKENSWTYYFQQPLMDYSVEEVYKSKKVIILEEGKTLPGFGVPYPWESILPAKPGEYAKWSRIFTKYIRLQPELEQKVNNWHNKLFSPGDRILGVGIRAGLRAGMLRNEALYNNHPKVASCEEYIEIVDEKRRRWNCNKIFLAFDDREYLEKFKKFFGSSCCYVERRLNHYFENDVPLYEREECQQEYEGTTTRQRTEEYIVETYLLSKCTCLYGSKGMAVGFAYFINEGNYEQVEMYDNGIYRGLEIVK